MKREIPPWKLLSRSPYVKEVLTAKNCFIWIINKGSFWFPILVSDTRAGVREAGAVARPRVQGRGFVRPDRSLGTAVTQSAPLLKRGWVGTVNREIKHSADAWLEETLQTLKVAETLVLGKVFVRLVRRLPNYLSTTAKEEVIIGAIRNKCLLSSQIFG